MTDRRKFMKGTLALPLLTAGAMSLHAQEPWPARTITLVVPFPPGGGADEIEAGLGNTRVRVAF